MSANDDRDDIQDDFDVSDEIKKVLKELSQNLAEFNKRVAEGSKTQGDQTKSFHRTHDQRLAEIKAQGDMVKENLAYRKSLQDSVSTMQMFTGALNKGVTVGGAFSMLHGSAQQLSREYEQQAEAVKQAKEKLENLQKAVAEEKDPAKKKELTRERDQQEKKVQGEEGVLKQKGMGKVFKGLGDFAEKHKTGLIIGAASVGTLVKVFKMALDKSPMMQQIYKMLNFGIMMILRPIGDFFGFLMRPIMVMLLRKFIIPWYTKMYPVMMQLGDFIGKKLAGAFEALAEGDVIKAFRLLFVDVDWGKVFGDAFSPIATWISTAVTTWASNIGSTDWELLWDEIVDWFTKGISGINAYWELIWYRLVSWFQTGVKELTDDFTAFWLSIYGWAASGIASIGGEWSKIWDAFWQWVTNGFASIGNDAAQGVSNTVGSGNLDKDLDWWNPLSPNKWGNNNNTSYNSQDNYTVNFYGSSTTDTRSSVRQTMQESTYRGRRR